jgi:hypothetical protein
VSSGSFEGADGDVLDEDLVDLTGDVTFEPSQDVEVSLAIR